MKWGERDSLLLRTLLASDELLTCLSRVQKHESLQGTSARILGATETLLYWSDTRAVRGLQIFVFIRFAVLGVKQFPRNSA
jgi:hypothetical protein